MCHGCLPVRSHLRNYHAYAVAQANRCVIPHLVDILEQITNVDELSYPVVIREGLVPLKRVLGKVAVQSLQLVALE